MIAGAPFFMSPNSPGSLWCVNRKADRGAVY